ncbi:MAG TPA: cytochrome C [Casimicrobiaceae bacterium]|nr:cytochrome C [Casimicrobiaceae bacterium]
MQPGTVRVLGMVVLGAAGMLGVVQAYAATGSSKEDPWVERGRYVVMIGGCNDCHTPGFAEHGGKAKEADLLTGDSLGWRGPWGTTYPPNLRLYFQTITEKEWLKGAKKFMARPPMPFWAVNHMGKGDLRALYRYVRSLGPSGHPAPEFVPPGEDPKTPYVQFPAPPK